MLISHQVAPTEMFGRDGPCLAKNRSRICSMTQFILETVALECIEVAPDRALHRLHLL
jgi:hypothetical protein